MKNLAERYILLLQNAYIEQGYEQQWKDFIETKQSITSENRDRLQELFPKTPQSLLDLFEFTDGSDYRHFEGTVHKVLGSDMEGLPYYLMSSSKIIEDPNFVKDCFDYLEKENYDIFDERIDNNNFNWLHFADDVANNGGISQLFIDFSPSKSGKIGQIIRYSHDAEELVVIADSFDEYLQQIIDSKFKFLLQDLS